MHCKITVILLIGCSLIVTSRQFIGDPISCTVSEIPAKVMDTYCWMHSTFTIPSKLGGTIGRDILQPGVADYVLLSGDDNEQQQMPKIKYHSYYQWVSFALFFQAVCFYLPRYAWKSWEGGKLEMLAADLSGPLVEAETKARKLRLLTNYFLRNVNRRDMYFTKFVVCEIMNLANVIGQAIFLDRFFDGEFHSYGLDVIRYASNQISSSTNADDDSSSDVDKSDVALNDNDSDNNNLQNEIDPMAFVFPKLTKCTFHLYGPSGTIQNYDGLCLLPLNVMNEKIYFGLWFWFFALAVITFLHLVYRVIVIVSPAFRMRMLHARCLLSSPTNVRLIVNKFRIGDWFVLYQLGKNIDVANYHDLVCGLYAELNYDDIV